MRAGDEMIERRAAAYCLAFVKLRGLAFRRGAPAPLSASRINQRCACLKYYQAPTITSSVLELVACVRAVRLIRHRDKHRHIDCMPRRDDTAHIGADAASHASSRHHIQGLPFQASSVAPRIMPHRPLLMGHYRQVSDTARLPAASQPFGVGFADGEKRCVNRLPLQLVR